MAIFFSGLLITIQHSPGYFNHRFSGVNVGYVHFRGCIGEWVEKITMPRRADPFDRNLPGGSSQLDPVVSITPIYKS